MFDAILFDLYETLVTERGTVPGRASSLGPRLGLDDVAFRKAWKPQRARVVRGELSFADALCEVGASLGCRVDPAAVHTLSDECRRQIAGTLRCSRSRSEPPSPMRESIWKLLDAPHGGSATVVVAGPASTCDRGLTTLAAVGGRRHHGPPAEAAVGPRVRSSWLRHPSRDARGCG
jgi:hypothetical protein